jgi:hypothetical protein
VRITLLCIQCFGATEDAAPVFLEAIRDDGLYSGKCPKGHDLLVATQTLRHEMLFEIALNAISDGYYREAVSSFAASSERFFEFAIRVITRNQGVQASVFDKAWKLADKHSERQLGAFLFLYVAHFSEFPRTLEEKTTGFRNKVIHKGLLPSKSDTIAFGREVYEVIQSGAQKLRASCLDDVNAELGAHVARIAGKTEGKHPAVQVTTTALNIIEDISSGYKPFETLLVERENFQARVSKLQEMA